MGEYKIYHAITMAHQLAVDSLQPRNHVGNVEADSLDDAYEKSNNIIEQWAPGQRSTSIGDVIEDVKAGTYHLVISIGFRQITESELGVAPDEKYEPIEGDYPPDLSYDE